MAADRLSSVTSKMPCVFETILLPLAPSSKRADQNYRVTASTKLRADATTALAQPSCIATEKLDGTCVLIDLLDGKPWLWARHDRKPSKLGEKRLKQFKASNAAIGKPQQRVAASFTWNVETDYNEAPDGWIPASGLVDSEGQLSPDANGHIPGWVPVNAKSRQYCWHASVVDLNAGVCLLLRHAFESLYRLEITVEPLSSLLGCTMELIGTCVNANPYRLGTKEKPLHLLVRHGSIRFPDSPPTAYASLVEWFEKNRDGRAEGIVWHCDGGAMYKLHRHHVNLQWPVEDPRLLSMGVRVDVSLEESEMCNGMPELIRRFRTASGKAFDSLDSIEF